MSNHLHLIAAAKESSKGLSAILGDFKRHTAKQIVKAIKTQPESRREWLLMVFEYHVKFNNNNSNYQVWIQHNHPIELISPKWIRQKLNYLHQNLRLKYGVKTRSSGHCRCTPSLFVQ